MYFRTTTIGNVGPKVPALGLGLMGLSAAYGTVPDDDERLKLLDRAVELGETFWDSANIYHDSEVLVGKWFQRTGKRNDIFIASKFGIVMDKWTFKGIDSSAAYCKQAIETSLERLGVDYIDLYYVHRINPDTPIEETMRAMAEIKAVGKIKHIGLCEPSATTLYRAFKIAPVDAVQIELSPFILNEQRSERDALFAACRDLGVTIIAYSPLGRGLLTGAITGSASVNGEGDLRGKMLPWFKDENIDTNVALVNKFGAIAKRKGCTPAQLSLAWVFKQGEDIIPIPGTKKIRYLEENWKSLEVALSDEEEKEISELMGSENIAGERSIPSHIIYSYAETKADS